MTDDTGPQARIDGQPPPPASILSEADVRRLAEAIRTGTASEVPSNGDLAFGTIKLLGVVVALIAFWLFFHWWRPAVNESYSTDISGTATLQLGSSHGGVNWSLPDVSASTVTLTGPASQSEALVLPVPTTECKNIQSTLGGSCNGGVLTLSTISVSEVWNPPQEMYLAPAPDQDVTGADQANTLFLQVSQGATSAGLAPTDVNVTINPSGAGLVNWCTAPLSLDATLTLRTVSATKPVTLVPSDFYDDPSCTSQGLKVVLQTVSTGGGPPTVAQTSFGGVTSVDVDASSGSVEAKDLHGILGLGDSGEDVLNGPNTVTLTARSPGNVQVTLGPDGTNTELAITSSKLASASSAGNDLVSSWWERNSTLGLPLFLALCGASFKLISPLVEDIRERIKTSRHTSPVKT